MAYSIYDKIPAFAGMTNILCLHNGIHDQVGNNTVFMVSEICLFVTSGCAVGDCTLVESGRAVGRYCDNQILLHGVGATTIVVQALN